MKLTQKNFPFSVTYEFMDNGINYTFKCDEGINIDFYSYENISNETIENEVRNTHFFNASVSIMVIGAIFFIYTIISKTDVLSYLFFISSIVLFALYRITAIKFTVLKTCNSQDLS